jgi:hypothetical protein
MMSLPSKLGQLGRQLDYSMKLGFELMMMELKPISFLELKQHLMMGLLQ